MVYGYRGKHAFHQVLQAQNAIVAILNSLSSNKSNEGFMFPATFLGSTMKEVDSKDMTSAINYYY